MPSSSFPRRRCGRNLPRDGPAVVMSDHMTSSTHAPTGFIMELLEQLEQRDREISAVKIQQFLRQRREYELI